MPFIETIADPSDWEQSWTRHNGQRCAVLRDDGTTDLGGVLDLELDADCVGMLVCFDAPELDNEWHHPRNVRPLVMAQR